MKDETLVIASSANEAYSIGLVGLLCSVVLSTDYKSVQFYVIEDRILPETKALILEKVTNLGDRRGIRVELRYIALSEIEMPDMPPMYGSHTAYARLFLPVLLEEKSIYYVDADIVCNRAFPSLRQMESQHGDMWFAACQDYLPSVEKDGLWCERYGSGLYVNTGFCWMNLDLMRKENFVAQICAAEDLFEGIRQRVTHYHDQTLVNCLCNGRIAEMDPEFNVVGSVLHGAESWDFQANWHFTGREKPWLLDATRPEYTLGIHVFRTLANVIGIADRMVCPAPLPGPPERQFYLYLNLPRYWLMGRKKYQRVRMQLKRHRNALSVSKAYAARISRRLQTKVG